MKRVMVVQYMRPGGNQHVQFVEVPDGVADKAKGMVLTCEVLTTGQVAIYGRWDEHDEDDGVVRFATNAPGPRQPDMVVIEVIEAVAAIPRGVHS